MQVEDHPIEAQRVGGCGGNLVNADSAVDVLDAVVDGAYVNVRYRCAVTKVHCNARHGAKTLQEENATLSLLFFFLFVFRRLHFSIKSTSTCSKSCHCMCVWRAGTCASVPASQYTDETERKKKKEKHDAYKRHPAVHTGVAFDKVRVSTSSRKTKKVTFLSRVATSVPSLVKSWRPLGAWLGHFWRVGLYFNSAPSVQLLEKARRYLEFIEEPKKTRMSHTCNTYASEV